MFTRELGSPGSREGHVLLTLELFFPEQEHSTLTGSLATNLQLFTSETKTKINSRK